MSERCDMSGCPWTARYVGELTSGHRLAVCNLHRAWWAKRVGGSWAWLKRLHDGAFPLDPNARGLRFPEEKP